MKKNKIIILLLIIISTIVIGSIGIQKYSNKDEVSKNSLISFIVDGQYQEKMPDMSTYYFNGYECNDSSVLLWNSKTSKLEARKFTVNSRCNAKFISKEKQSDEVIYTLANGDYIESRKQKKDASVTLPTPTKDGYEFLGWYYEDETKVPDNVTAEDLDGKKIIAKWKAATYTITFDANGGSVTPTTKQVTHNSTYGELPIPTRKGYKFLGWFTATNGGEQKSSTTKVEIIKNETLYAHWEANEYTITFDAQGGAIKDQSIKIKYNETQNLQTANRVGYTFEGWYTNATAGNKVDEPYKMTTDDNVTLYAHWKAKTFTVTLNANGGKVDPSSITVTYDSKYSQLVDATWEEHTFEGWYMADDKKITKDDTVKITDNITLYAHWINNGGTDVPDPTPDDPTPATIGTSDLKVGDIVNYSATGKEGTISEWVVIKQGANPELIAKTASPNPYTLEGQEGYLKAIKNLNDEAKSYIISTSIVSEARHMGYSNQVEQCTTIDNCKSDTGYATDVGLVKAAMNNKLEIEDGCSGGHYWLASRASESEYDIWTIGCSNGDISSQAITTAQSFAIRPIITLNSDITFSKKEGENVYELLAYIITYDSNGGQELGPSLVKPGGRLDLPTPYREGFDFSGWYTDDNVKIESTSEITKSQTLHARWTIKSYTITFDTQGGNFADENETGKRTVDYGGSITSFPADPTRDGYTFDGWWSAQNGGYKKDENSQFTSALTLFAHWKSSSGYWNDDFSGTYYPAGEVPDTVHSNEIDLIPSNSDTVMIFTQYEGTTPKSHENVCLYFKEYNKSVCTHSNRWYEVNSSYAESSANGKSVKESLQLVMESFLGEGTTTCESDKSYAKCSVGESYFRITTMAVEGGFKDINGKLHRCYLTTNNFVTSAQCV